MFTAFRHWRSPRLTLVLTAAGLLGTGLALGGYQAFNLGSAPEEPLIKACDPASGIPGARVELARSTDGETVTYRIKTVTAPDGSNNPVGWVLNHRPAGKAKNRFLPDTVLKDEDVIGATFTDKLISKVQLFYPLDMKVVSTLTCPGGDCLISPISGCRATYNRDTDGSKIALAGDSLLVWDETCSIEPPPAPDFCPLSLGLRLQMRGARVFSQSNSGQGFYTWLPVIREQATTRPHSFVIALGTNDALKRQAKANDADRPARRKQTELAVHAALRDVRAVSPSTCIVLVNAAEKALDESKQNLEPHYAQEARFVNEVIRREANNPDHGGRIFLVDWAKATREHCGESWLNDPKQACDWYRDDQIHLVGKGTRERNELILKELERCGGL